MIKMAIATSGLLMCLSGVMLGGYRDTLYFHPIKQISTTPIDLGVPFKEIFLQEESFMIHVWQITRKSTTRNLIFSHGNAGNMSHRVRIIKFLYDKLPDYNLFFYDYPGFGKSDSNRRPNIADCVKSLDGVTQYVERRFGDKIIMYGESIGTGIVTDYLQQSKKKYPCVLQSAFTSIADIMPSMMGSWGNIAYYLVGNDLNNLQNVRSLRKRGQKVAILHSQTDEIISYDHFIRLAPYATVAYDISGGHNMTEYNKTVIDAIRNVE